MTKKTKPYSKKIEKVLRIYKKNIRFWYDLKGRDEFYLHPYFRAIIRDGNDGLDRVLRNVVWNYLKVRLKGVKNIKLIS